ncbi:hypothetical protein KKC1_22490 [Calderihabitans maritimus]|uniref:Uncharacterized protein n=1 Tax=Calderihabitans maritimus TaxID=1246530 RepID=A0A1Z5HUM5_9FIRM|nr:hypothetical protein KKC1_22490 [Calderihabitans maritimus]
MLRANLSKGRGAKLQGLRPQGYDSQLPRVEGGYPGRVAFFLKKQPE